MKRALATAIALLTLSAAAVAGEISVHGSSTMSELNKRLAADFEKANPGMKVTIVTSDSAQGIADLVAGTANLAAASRAIKPEESAKVKAVGLPIARDGIAIYVHALNKVDALTMQQLEAIFSGKIRNWKEVGGADAAITVYVRESGSGTADFFKERVLGGKSATYASGAKEMKSTADLVAAVAKDPSAIGYAGEVATKAAKILTLRKAAGSPAIAPTREAVVSGDYPLARILYYYVNGMPQGDLLKFTQWVLSPAGQQTVMKSGYFPAK